jgi:CoA:oxalate CoA-transferase
VTRPLEGMRILDIAETQQGLLAAKLLADMGADVVKIERAGEPRRGAPVDLGEPAPSSWELAMESGKRSIAVAPDSAGAAEVMLAFARGADAIVAPLGLGLLAELGLDEERLRAESPRAVLAITSPYGPLGPLADAPGADITAQALGGIMWKTGDPDDPPLPAGVALAEVVGALYLCIGLLAAVTGAERQGRGRRVDVSLYGAQIGMQSWEIDSEWLLGRVTERISIGHPDVSDRRICHTFETAEGWLQIAGVLRARWSELCDMIGEPEMSERWPEAAVSDHIDEIVATFRDRLRTRPLAEWLDEIAQRDILGVAVQNDDDIAADPQARENGYVLEVEHPQRGAMSVVGAPFMFGREPLPAGALPHEPGADADALLAEIGYAPDAIAALRADGVVA